MSGQIESKSSVQITSGKRGEPIAGIALIGIGLLVLLVNLTNLDLLGLLFIPMLGVIFLAWGIGTRNVGLIIPGGILSGIGLGVLLIEGPLNDRPGDVEGGIFLLAFALGWCLITLLSALFTDKTHWWPLIPGGIMALVGLAIVAGGVAMQLLEIAGVGWPLILVAVGIFVIYKYLRTA